MGAEASENGYIQGAGDDNEGWSCGLTPQVFWQYRLQLMNTVEEALPGLIGELLKTEGAKDKSNAIMLLAPTKNIYVGTSIEGQLKNFDGIIVCRDPVTNKISEGNDTPGHVLHLCCGIGKLGSRALRAKLPLVPAFVSALTAQNNSPKILITCSTGNDLSVGVALALLCLFFDGDGKLQLLEFIAEKDSAGHS